MYLLMPDSCTFIHEQGKSISESYSAKQKFEQLSATEKLAVAKTIEINSSAHSPDAVWAKQQISAHQANVEKEAAAKMSPAVSTGPGG